MTVLWEGAAADTARADSCACVSEVEGAVPMPGGCGLKTAHSHGPHHLAVKSMMAHEPVSARTRACV